LGRLQGHAMSWMRESDRSGVDSFAAFDALDAVLARTGNARVVIAFMPYYAPRLPAPGTLTAERLDKCKLRAERLARTRGTAYLDMLQDDRLTRDPANFWDPPHYRSHIARVIENAIADAVRSPPAAARN
jgi:hypothetical protein